MSISAVVITHNEEANIERCLKGLSFADEIVVVDSHSTDRTVELARRYTDKVFLREFTGYSDQKSAALALAECQWVLVIDADEIVSDELADEIISAADDGRFDAYRIPRSSYFLGRRMRHCGWYPDYQLRLVRRDKARFPDRLVHETMTIDGECGTLEHDLVHYSYPSMDVYVRKMVEYARAAARQRFIEGRRFRLTDILVRPGFTFLRMYLVSQGFKDGIHGLVLSVLAACSCALRYAMLWEMTARPGSITKIRKREEGL